jgi:tetratricopeptide (TPR) repeat protein
MESETGTYRWNSLARLASLGIIGSLLITSGCGEEEKREPETPAVTVEKPGLVERVLPAFLAARGKSWPRPSKLMMQAHEAVMRRDFEKAQTYLKQEVKANPDSVEVLFLLSEINYHSARFDVALAGFKRVLRQGPRFGGNEHIFHLYGLCQMRLGNARQAREAFRALIQLKPGDGGTYQKLGMLDLQEGSLEGAIANFEQAIRMFETAQEQGQNVNAPLSRGYARMGDALLLAGRLEEARDSLEKGLYLNPEDPKAHYALSRVLFRLGDAEGASREMKEFEKRKPGGGANRPSTPSRN